MLYATCSILDEENSHVVRQFLATQSDAQLLENGVTWGTAAECGRQLLPSAGGADGMFYALLGKSREIPA